MSSPALANVLVRLSIDQLCFLKLSGEDIVSPAAAVDQVANVGRALDSLRAEDRVRLAELIGAEGAKMYAADAASVALRFIESIPDVVGLKGEGTRERPDRRVVEELPLVDVLARVLTHHLCFLELCGDDDVNPDAAVRQLEAVTAELASLGEPDRQHLVRCMRAEAAALNAAGADSAKVDCIETMPDGIGLEDSDF